ncbi:hypothetical protein NADFUDRAFT_40735 [Nadsonia fulvescens var. elongata DSM 6958]|uniref:Ribophorin II C-terminal domain-containing protein n=1 Tax=Nadsonia fulvescens var. elongata DSM 6958 TaxID=857566 RepID=A0A1E3PQ79_9ASCO|nr:hypothetical protein NADFUDRAFT_40735 [Nadsonia fulvescens var. elongata DSM 6958]
MKFGSSLSVALMATTVLANHWSITDASLSIGPRTEQLDTSSKTIRDELRLGLDSNIKLSYNTLLGESKSRAHQNMVLLRDSTTGLETTFIVHAKPSGKSKILISSKSIPSALKNGNPLDLELIIGSFSKNEIVESENETKTEEDNRVNSDVVKDSIPFRLKIASNIVIDNESEPSAPVRFGPKPIITHQFRASPRTVSPFISGLFSIAAASLVVVLLGVWFSVVGVNAKQFLPAFSESPIGHVSFWITIIGFEIVWIKYFIGMSIFDALGYSALLAPLGVVGGVRALKEIRSRREKNTF